MPIRNSSTTIELEYPFPEDRVFRYQAMQDVLSLLIEDPYEEFTVSQLAEMVDANQATVSKAVRLLRELGPIQTRRDGRKRYVSIDRARLTKPDPVLSIPQAEFHKPVRAFVDRLQADLDDLVGVLLFGSVARGEADRASDIDLLVIIADDKTRVRRTVQSIVSDLEATKFDGNRYTFEVLVESVDSASRIGDRLQQQFDSGITLVGTDELSTIRREVYADGDRGGPDCRLHQNPDPRARRAPTEPDRSPDRPFTRLEGRLSGQRVPERRVVGYYVYQIHLIARGLVADSSRSKAIMYLRHLAGSQMCAAFASSYGGS